MKKLFLFVFVAALLFSTVSAQNQEVKKPDPINVLVFSKTKGFRHNSISNGIKMISDLGRKENWVVTSTENADLFTSDFLYQMDVVVFLNPTGDALDDKQQKAFEKFMKNGKGFVGIHAATDCRIRLAVVWRVKTGRIF